MQTIAEILRDKGSEVWSVGPDEVIMDALKIMAEKGVGALLVMEYDKLVGILVSVTTHAKSHSKAGHPENPKSVKSCHTEYSAHDPSRQCRNVWH